MTFLDNPLAYILIYLYIITVFVCVYFMRYTAVKALGVCVDSWMKYATQQEPEYKMFGFFTLNHFECFGAFLAANVLFVLFSLWLTRIPNWFYGTATGKQFIQEMDNSWYMRMQMIWGVRTIIAVPMFGLLKDIWTKVLKFPRDLNSPNYEYTITRYEIRASRNIIICSVLMCINITLYVFGAQLTMLRPW